MNDRTQAMTATHTPTPWRVEEGTDLIWGACNPDDQTTRGMGYAIVQGASPGWKPFKPLMAEREANATFIVEAVNSHEALKARIQELEAELASCRACREKIDCISRDWNYTGPGLLGPSCKD